MTILLFVLLVASGLLLAPQVIAALYAVIDLAHGLPGSIPRILARVLLWCGGAALAVWLLGRIGGRAAEDALCRLRRDRDHEVAAAALRALNRLGQADCAAARAAA